MAIADGKVVIQIDADSKGFETDLNKVTISANELGTQALKGLAAGVTAATAAFTAGTAAAIAAGSAYETAFAQTMTIMDQSVVSAGDMSDAIIDLSNDTGTAATALSESVYNAISATGDTANAVSLVADSSKLATAGFAEEGDALSVLTTITNAYGMATTEASNISDSLIQTQNLGVTTVGQLASSMGKAIATASAYSINLYNLESAYVSLTKAGISTEESTTYLSSMFNELGDSGSDVAAIIQNQTGKSFGQLMKSGASLGDVLDILLQSVDGDTEALMNLWGSAEAGKAASAIAGQGVKTFNSNLEQLQHSTGLTEKAYQTMANTLSFQTDKLKTRITNLGTAVYEYFDGSLTEGVSSLSDAFLELTDSVKDGELSDKMEDISEGVANLIHTGSELAADVIPALINGASWVLDNGNTVITIIGGTTAAVLAYKAVATTVSLTVNPFGLAVAGAIAFTTAAVAASDILTKVSPEVQALNDSTEETSAATKALAEHLATVIAEYELLQAETTSNKSANDNLITSVVQMASTYDGAASSAAAIQRIVEELNSAIPGLNLAFDEQTGTLNKTEAAMRAYNEQWAAQQDYDAAMEANAEAIAGVQTATDNLTKSQNGLEQAQKAVQDYWDKYSYNGDMPEMFARGWTEVQAAAVVAKNAMEGCQDELDQAGKVALRTGTRVTQYSKELDNATDAAAEFADTTDDSADALENQKKQVSENTKSLAEIRTKAYEAANAGKDLRESYEELSKEAEKYTEDADAEIAADTERALYKLNLAATNQELGASYSSLGLEVNSSLTSMAEYLISTGVSVDEFESGVSSMRDSVVNNFQSIKNENALTANEIVKNLESNLKAQQAWSQNLSDMWEQAYSDQDAQVMAFINYLAQKGPDYAAEVQSFANAGYSKLQEAASLWSQTGEQSASDYAAGIWMQQYVAGLAGEGMAQAALDSASGVDVSGAGQQLTEDFASGVSGQESEVTAAGEDVGEALITGLESQEASLKTSAAALATAAINIWTAKAGTFRSTGASAATSLASGISSGSGTVSSAASSVAYAAQSAMRIGGWYNLGYNISAGVADGVSAGSYLITRAAQNAAQNALNAAKSTLGVHSPSRVFRDEIGQMIPAGMAEGITLGASKATAAVELTADQLLAATRVALRPSGSMMGAQYVNNTISNSYFGGSSGGNIILEAPVYLDGREIARASAKYTGRQMAYLEGL